LPLDFFPTIFRQINGNGCHFGSDFRLKMKPCQMKFPPRCRIENGIYGPLLP
jgi:hypothetical protein